MSESRKGLLLGFSAYALWGLVPLYWPLLAPAGAVELLAHRVLWSALLMGALTVALGRTTHFRALVTDRRTMVLLTIGATVVSVNWGLYIWGVTHGRVIETSLGYFINPLITMLMGVAVMGERLRRTQWVAVGIATVAVLVLTVDYGRLPYLSLALALSFGVYGLVKKTANVGAVESLTVETVLMTPLAVGYVVWLAMHDTGHFLGYGIGHSALFASAGLVTAVPLLLFGASAVRVSMVTLGLLQYLAPIIQFLLGLLWFHEDMTAGRWIGFVLVWAALVLFSGEGVRHRRQSRLAVEASAV